MKEHNMKKQSNTDWKKIEKISDKEIDFSDIPELDESFFKTATLQVPKNKESVSIRLDADVLNWFKQQGRGYQTKINAILRMYMRAKTHSKK